MCGQAGLDPSTNVRKVNIIYIYLTFLAFVNKQEWTPLMQTGFIVGRSSYISDTERGLPAS